MEQNYQQFANIVREFDSSKIGLHPEIKGCAQVYPEGIRLNSNTDTRLQKAQLLQALLLFHDKTSALYRADQEYTEEESLRLIATTKLLLAVPEINKTLDVLLQTIEEAEYYPRFSEPEGTVAPQFYQETVLWTSK